MQQVWETSETFKFRIADSIMLEVNALSAFSDMFLMMELAEWSVINAKLGTQSLAIVLHAMMVLLFQMEHVLLEEVKNPQKNQLKNLKNLKNPMKLMDATLMPLMEVVQHANIEELESVEPNVEELATNATLGMLQMVPAPLVIVVIPFLMGNANFDTLLSLNFLKYLYLYLFK